MGLFSIKTLQQDFFKNSGCTTFPENSYKQFRGKTRDKRTNVQGVFHGNYTLRVQQYCNRKINDNIDQYKKYLN